MYTKAASVLAASIRCVSCRDTNQFSISSSQVIKLVGGCDDCPSRDVVYRWTITRSDGVVLPVNLATTTTGDNRRNLVVRASVVQPGYAYRSAPPLSADFRSHRRHCEQCVLDAACRYRRCLDVAWSVCLSVYVLVRLVSPANAAEPILRTGFGCWLVWARGTMYYMGPDPMGRDTFEGCLAH